MHICFFAQFVKLNFKLMTETKSLFYFLGACILFIALQSAGCEKNESSGQPNETLYGTAGPAGGYIFYDKGYYSDGWRYLEAAPYDTHTGVLWGCTGVSAGNISTDIGSGENNTNEIVSFQSPSGQISGCIDANTAAKVCQNFNYNGYSDWFLPSETESYQMFKNLHAQGLGGFLGVAEYWTSSQTGGGSALNQAYSIKANSYSNSIYSSKNANKRVRAIRSY